MKIGVVFWVLMILWAVFWAYGFFTPEARGYGWYHAGHGLLFFILFSLLGWRNFGPPVQNS